MQARTRLLPQGEKYDRGRIDEGPMHADCAWYCKEAFQEVIRREAVRSSRSGRSPLLLLFDVSVWESTQMTQKITSVLSSSTWEIDVKGWYTDGAVMGILFTEFGKMHLQGSPCTGPGDGRALGLDRAFKCSRQGYNHRKQAPV